MKLAAPRTPCNTCPYRRDTPPGVWHQDEYQKLEGYDENRPGGESLATFHCHQENVTGRPTVCRGWVSCHGFKSIAVRLAVARGEITVAKVEAPCPVPLYGSGKEACRAGLRGVRRPNAKARQAIDKLGRRMAAKPKAVQSHGEEQPCSTRRR